MILEPSLCMGLSLIFTGKVPSTEEAAYWWAWRPLEPRWVSTTCFNPHQHFYIASHQIPKKTLAQWQSQTLRQIPSPDGMCCPPVMRHSAWAVGESWRREGKSGDQVRLRTPEVAWLP